MQNDNTGRPLSGPGNDFTGKVIHIGKLKKKTLTTAYDSVCKV